MTVRKSISFTSNHDAWIKAQIKSGKYATESEVIRDLIRLKQEQDEKFEALKNAIQEGLDSGVSDRTVEDIRKDVAARLRQDGRLPA
ncbi:MAG: type II toxin-antitoxin system ParD family antitoxin [Kiloniellales bacterium]|nr:type II toxin-antitoxin system ParD family antitoxin [Kiloniellales bacterium]